MNSRHLIDIHEVKKAIIEESARWDTGGQNTPAAWLALRDFAKSIGINVTLDEQYKASLSRMEPGQ